MPGMETEAFYTTAAQVLPTLLIALTVEIGFILGVRSRDRQDPRWKDWAESSMFKWFAGSFALGAVFLVGEVLAFLAIGFRWFNGWTFTGIGVCLLVMAVSIVLIVVIRINEVLPPNE